MRTFVRPVDLVEKMHREMPLTSIEKSLLVAAYFRGGGEGDERWISNCDQIVTLSLFYTGDVTAEDCSDRFSQRSCVGKLHDAHGELSEPIANRYQALIELIRANSNLIKGGGDLKTPADPTFTACRLTSEGQQLALSLIKSFPRKSEFPNWPDKRSPPET